MTTETLYAAIGQIDDDTINEVLDAPDASASSTATAPMHTARTRNARTRNERTRTAAFARRFAAATAACLVIVTLAVTAAVILPSLTQNTNDGGVPENMTADGNGIVLTTPPYDSLSPHPDDNGPTLRWEHSLIWRLSLDLIRWNADDEPVVILEFNLADAMLGDGALRLSVDCADFTCRGATEFVYPDYTYDKKHGLSSDSVALTFVPPAADAQGVIYFNFYFIPDKPDDEMSAVMSGGMLPLASIPLNFVKDKFGTEFSVTSGVHELTVGRLCRLYEEKVLDGAAFAERYFSFVYADKISSAVDVVSSDGESFRFFYMSRDIRYVSPYITDAALIGVWDAVKNTHGGNTRGGDGRTAGETMARACLDHMLREDIVTRAEYDSECERVKSVYAVDFSGVGFSGDVADYADVLQNYMTTH